MKFSLVTLALMLSSLASAQTVSLNQWAFNSFYDADGNTGFVYVTRTVDPVTLVKSTTLYYSFCVQTTAASCLEGSGPIPNSAFAGKLDGNSNKAETVKLAVDTNLAGFSNDLCNAPNPFGGCDQGKSPATGGVVYLSYVTTVGSVEIITVDDYVLRQFKIVRNSRDRIFQGPGSVVGTVIGASVKNNGASWGIENLSGKGAFGSAQQAQTQSTFEKSLAPQTRARLQKLRGDKPTN